MGALFFVALLGYALAGMLLLPRLKAGHALLCAVCGMLAAAYYGVIVAGAMVPVAYGLMGGGLLAAAMGLAALALNKRALRKRVFSPAMGLFVLACAAAAVCCGHMLIQDHDSYSYWLRAVRELYTFDTFYIRADSTMFHTDYTPLLAALEYCVVRVFGWSDAAVAFVPFACVITAIAALCDLVPKKRWACLAAVLLTYAFGAFGFSLFATRSDGPMLAVFAAGLMCLTLREEDSVTALLPTLCAAAVLVGFKIYSGLMFAAVLALALLTAWLKAPKAQRKTLGALSLAALGLMLAMQCSWSAVFHYRSALASHEAAAAHAAYLGLPFSEAAPAFSLRYLFGGNPRTAQLGTAFTAENLQRFGSLAWQTCAQYAASPQVWTLPLLLIPLCLCISRQQRRACLATSALLLTAAAIYLLGLFGSYFVQSETSGAALNYLATASTPLLMAAVLLSVRIAADGRRKAACLGPIALAASLVLLLSPAQWPAQWNHVADEDSDLALLAKSYYADELDGQLTSEDAGKRALLIDCSYAATQIKSPSGKTHVYSYYGLPMHVTVVQWPFEDYSLLDGVTPENMTALLESARPDVLLVRVEDEFYWEALAAALEMDEFGPATGVYDVERADGAFTLTPREEW